MPDDQEPGCYTSPPCFMHELDPSGAWRPDAGDERQAADVARWRKTERQRLLEQRLTHSPAERAEMARAISARLDQLVGDVRGRIVSGYWPIRGEPNLLDWLTTVSERGATCVLPVVVGKGRPLVFRAWKSGQEMERGVWNIPVPPAGPELIPDIVLAPVVGFDRASFRLGYGGGFFDRTLAALDRKPFTVGVGYSDAAISTIYPQWHDCPMDAIVTEAARSIHDRSVAAHTDASSS